MEATPGIFSGNYGEELYLRESIRACRPVWLLNGTHQIHNVFLPVTGASLLNGVLLLMAMIIGSAMVVVMMVGI